MNACLEEVAQYRGNEDTLRVMNVVLITGASSGIGAATAIEFAEAGWNVMAAGRDEGRLEEVADVSDKISTWAGELVDSEDCDELVADTIDEFGAIDCLINSAGVLPRGNAEETSDETWRDTMSINLDVPFYLSRAALPYLLQTGGMAEKPMISSPRPKAM